MGDFAEPASPPAPLRGEGSINGEIIPDGAETAHNPSELTEVDNVPTTEEKRQQKPQKGQKRTIVADNPPSLEEVQAYFDERTQQGKPFLYITPEGFYDACCQSGWTLNNGKPMMDWRARVRTFESYRKEHGDRPVAVAQQHTPRQHPRPGDPVPATKPRVGKYNRKW